MVPISKILVLSIVTLITGLKVLVKVQAKKKVVMNLTSMSTMMRKMKGRKVSLKTTNLNLKKFLIMRRAKVRSVKVYMMISKLLLIKVLRSQK